MSAQQVVSLNTATPQLEAPQAGSTYTFPRAITGTTAFGVAGSSLGAISFAGDTSGMVTVQPATAAGTWTLTLPTGAGTNTYALLTNGSGVTSWGQIAIGTAVSGLGTGVATALAVNVGSAGAPVVLNGALGTPSSGTLTNATGLPVSTGISGLGTGVATALAVNTGTAGCFVVNGGALGTPSGGTLTSCTGLPISTGVSGLGTGVATFLATPSSANLASAVTGETGSGALVFATSPALTDGTVVISTPVATSIGFLGAPQMADQDDYTLVITDTGYHYYHVSATPHTLTIPANASVAFPVGTIIHIINENGAGNLTVAITSDTLRWGASTGSRTIAANGSASVIKVTSTVWRMTGDGIT